MQGHSLARATAFIDTRPWSSPLSLQEVPVMQWKNSVGFAVLAVAFLQFFVATGAAALAISAFFALNFLHIYYDRCLYRFSGPSVREKISPLLLWYFECEPRRLRRRSPRSESPSGKGRLFRVATPQASRSRARFRCRTSRWRSSIWSNCSLWKYNYVLYQKVLNGNSAPREHSYTRKPTHSGAIRVAYWVPARRLHPA